MKKIFSILIFCAAIAAAQTNRFPPINLYSGDPTGQSCPTANTLVQSTTTGGIYSCIGGIWTYGSGTISNPVIISQGGTSCTTAACAFGELGAFGGSVLRLSA